MKKYEKCDVCRTEKDVAHDYRGMLCPLCRLKHTDGILLTLIRQLRYQVEALTDIINRGGRR